MLKLIAKLKWRGPLDPILIVTRAFPPFCLAGSLQANKLDFGMRPASYISRVWRLCVDFSLSKVLSLNARSFPSRSLRKDQAAGQEGEKDREEEEDFSKDGELEPLLQ